MVDSDLGWDDNAQNYLQRYLFFILHSMSPITVQFKPNSIPVEKWWMSKDFDLLEGLL